MTARLVAALAALSLLACGGPRDPEGTLARVRNGTMRVGVIDDRPFAAMVGGEAVGVEPALVRAFAGELNARVAWFGGSAPELLEAL
ncbi:MAG TPA: hypothetical protein VFI96_06770, partial [Longimicrobiaceae bacterium]|nr:hypothetical protein [Longimicrobiaceae bacterium]